MPVTIPPAPPATPKNPARTLKNQGTRAAFRTRVATLASGCIGYVEGLHNHTPFGAWIGLNGLAWCISFDSYIYAAAARDVDCENPLAGVQTPKGPAGATELYRVAKAKGWALEPGEAPLPADLAIWDHDNVAGGPGHGGIVVAVHADGTVSTVEGNTSRLRSATQAQARNGGEVARHDHGRNGGGRPSHGRFLGLIRPTRRIGQ